MHQGALHAWLAQRDPAPPARLSESILALLPRGAGTSVAEGRNSADGAAGPIADALVRASVETLRRLLAAGGTDREIALELLAADAMATYAFEAAAEEPAQLDARCRAAMRRFSEVVDGA